MSAIDLKMPLPQDSGPSEISAGGAIDLQFPDPSNPTPSEGSSDVTSPEFTREAYFRDLARSLNPIEAQAVALQGGLQNMGRGLTTGDNRTEAQRLGEEALRREQPATILGDVIGNALPIAPAAVATGGAATAPLAARAGLGGLVAGVEGFGYTRGQGAEPGQIALATVLSGLTGVASEVAVPVLARSASNLWGKLSKKARSWLNQQQPGSLVTREGMPTPEFKSILDSANVSLDELTDEAVDRLRQSSDLNPEQVARRERFEQQGIPYTTGDVTQDILDQATEQRFLSNITSEAGQVIRTQKSQQFNAFESVVNDYIDGLGMPDVAGETIKSALASNKQMSKRAKNRYYKVAANLADMGEEVPIPLGGLREALPDARTMRSMVREEPGLSGSFNELMAEFGIDKSAAAQELLEKSGVEPRVLSISNFEEFRRELTRIARDPKGGVMAGGVKSRLDGILDELADALPEETSSMTVEAFRRARGLNTKLMTEFSPQSLVGRLVGTRPDRSTPIVEASRVVSQLRTQPVEQFQKVLSQLARNPKGRVAIQNLKAAVVRDALEAGLKSEGRKADGQRLISGAKFSKYLEQFGRDKLEILFRGDPDGLRVLDGFVQTARDMTPPNLAVPDGSAPINMELMEMSGLGKIGRVMRVVSDGTGAVREGGQVRQAMAGLPQKEQAEISELLQAFPAIAATMGVPLVAENLGDD